MCIFDYVGLSISLTYRQENISKYYSESKIMITVLMSTYNGEKYLREQINSILNQANVDVKILIRDDGSTDNTVNILKEYEQLNEKIKWYTGPNLGCGKSFFQLILDAPQSDYYAFADQDDVWDIDKLAIAVSKLQSCPDDVPALYCSFIRPVDENLNIIPYIKPKTIVLTFGIALVQAIAPGCSYVFNNLLLVKFKKNGINNIDIHDWALLRVVTALDGFVYYDTEPHFSYRQHGNNVIGYQGSFVAHWARRINRFRRHHNLCIRSKNAKILKNIYYDELSEKNKKIIDTISNYKINLEHRIQLIKSPDIKMISNIDNFVLRILILLNKM